jgi:hypothetical protein
MADSKITRPIKLPLPTSFAQLCGFVGKLRDGLVLLSTDKHDVNGLVSFTIPTSGWGTDHTVPSHPNYIDIEIEGLLASDIVEVNVAPGSTEVARKADFTPTQTLAGKLRLHCKNIPESQISAEYHITNTVAYTT